MITSRIRILLVVIWLAGCTSTDRGELEALDRVREFAEAQVTIEHLRKQEEVNWSEIENCWTKTAPLVAEIDATFNTQYGTEIPVALEKCKRGEQPRVNQQIMAKGLQHVAVLAMRGELDAVAEIDGDEAKAAAERVAAYFEGIRPTFSRRDSDYFAGRPTLETAADDALAQLQTAAEAGGTQTVAARRQLEDAIYRTYALSVLYEVEKIEELRDTNSDECEVKRMEAIIFYRILEPRISRHNADAHEVLTKMLASGYGMMSAEVVEDNLRRGVPAIPLRRQNGE